LFRTLSIVS